MTKNYLPHENIEKRLVREVGIVDVINHFGVTEILDNIGLDAIKAYLESVHDRSEPDAANTDKA